MKQNIDLLETKIRDLQNELARLQGKYDKYDRWFNILGGMLAVLALINTLFLVGVGAFGYLSLSSVQDVYRERDRITELRRGFEDMNANAEQKYATTLDTLRAIKESFDRTYEEMVSLQTQSKTELKISVNQIKALKTESENLKLLMEDELTGLKARITGVNIEVKNLANIFYRAALNNQAVLNSREIALLNLLARKVQEETGLAVDEPGRYAYNLAVSYLNIGEYSKAIDLFKMSLEIQPNLPSKQRQMIEDYINICKKQMKQLEEVLSVEVHQPISWQIEDWGDMLNATYAVLNRIGILDSEKKEEIIKQAIYENRTSEKSKNDGSK
jgi:tetratricopeptide (TPR) repeat protein